MLLLNQPVKVDEQLANALLLIAPRSDLVDMIRVSPKIHQTLQHVLKSSIASITTLVPLPASIIIPAVGNRRYPKQNNWSPYLTPRKLINASSLVNGPDTTPLDVNLLAAATLE